MEDIKFLKEERREHRIDGLDLINDQYVALRPGFVYAGKFVNSIKAQLKDLKAKLKDIKSKLYDIEAKLN